MPGLFDKSNPKGVYAELSKLEQTLGLRHDFCEDLRMEDDWSFIIKLHALLEAALTTLIVETLGKDSLRSIFSEIEMSRDRVGKVAFASALELLTDYERRFIVKLSELRNRLVHNIANVTFNLKAYVDSLEKNQKAAFVHAFSLMNEKDEEFESMRSYFLNHPKTTLWQVGLLLLSFLSMKTDTARAHRDIDGTLRDPGHKHFRDLQASKSALQRLFEEASSTGQTPEEEGPPT